MPKLECVITVRDEPLAEKVFLSEEKEFNHKRSGYSVITKDDNTIITIHADDPSALRATVTSVTRVLNILKRMQE